MDTSCHVDRFRFHATFNPFYNITTHSPRMAVISPGYILRLTPQTALTSGFVSEVNVLAIREMTMDSVPAIEDATASMSSPVNSASSEAVRDRERFRAPGWGCFLSTYVKHIKERLRSNVTLNNLIWS